MSIKDKQRKRSLPVVIQGEGNHTLITNTQNSVLHLNDSNIFLQNSSELSLSGNRNNFQFQNCRLIRVDGCQNEFHGERLLTTLVRGEDNTIAAKSTVDLVLSGSRGLFDLGREMSPKIYGNENRVMASENVNLLVCGGSNCVVAEKNHNLKVRGNYSNVVAYRSCNVTVDGQRSQVLVRNTMISHHLMRVPVGPTNHIRFTGSPLKCCVYDGITFPSFQPPQLMQDFAGTEEQDGTRSIQDQLFGPLELPPSPNEDWTGLEHHRRPATVLVPQLTISYVDRIAIDDKYYVSGIFHFRMESLTEEKYGGELSTLIGLQVILSELDEDSFSSGEIGTGKEKYTVIVGNKDGVKQTLKISGPHIMKCKKPNEFVVNLDPEAGGDSEEEVEEEEAQD